MLFSILDGEIQVKITLPSDIETRTPTDAGMPLKRVHVRDS